MKKLLALIALVFTFSPTALAYTEGWEMSSFDAEIWISNDATVTIQETIIADFTNEAHRGIARDIPYKADGYNSQIDIGNAVDENGQSWISNVYRNNGYVTVEMTNPKDEYRNTIDTFILTYTANNVILYHDDKDFDEFYWNVNGTDNPVPTNTVSATIYLPTEDKVELTCFTGAYGDTEHNCEFEQDGGKVTIKATEPLAPYENLSIAIAIPKGIIEGISLTTKIWWWLEDNFVLILPLITLMVMSFLWYTKGRDEKTFKTTVMPHYKPPKNLLPTETGILIDETLHPQDVTATIIDYAIKGYIRINEIKKEKLIGSSTDYEFELLKPYKTEKEYEKLVMEGIFLTDEPIGKKVKVSELKNRFYKQIPYIQKSATAELIKNGYFPHNPHTVRKGYHYVGGAIAVIGFYVGNIFDISTTISLIATGIIIIAIGHYLPRKTAKGTETYYQLKGLYEYIKTAEKDRLEFQEKADIFFEKLLPYAIAFGLTKKWAKAFEGIITAPPNWYHGGYNGSTFDMVYFADRLSRMTQVATTNMATSPNRGGGAFSGGSGFGGGGFSGGGFGGGGSRGL